LTIGLGPNFVVGQTTDLAIETQWGEDLGEVLDFPLMRPKLRVWVMFGRDLKFGDGRARLLELIDQRGSLRQAAAELDMSYRNAWGYLQELERAAGFKFLERAPSGHPRSGMHLTPRGKAFLAGYWKFQRSLQAVAERRFARAFEGDPPKARGRQVTESGPQSRGPTPQGASGSRGRGDRSPRPGRV
jgi:molybdate transport system regulatory protein